MSPQEALRLIVAVTLLAVWVVSALDIVRRHDLRPARRIAWGALVVLGSPIGSLLYLLARPVPVGRTIIGAPVDAPVPVPTSAPHPGAVTVQHISRLAVRALFRDVEVVRPAAVRSVGPQIWAASHLGGLSDPLVLLHALERQPRFLAADVLWRVPVLRWLLRAAGAIPVSRGGRDQRTSQTMFEAARGAMTAGDAIAIFPEGVVVDAPAIAPIRTGTARIALGAWRARVPGIQIVPVGIHYQDLAALRSRVYVDIGAPLDLEPWLALQPDAPDRDGADDQHLVRQLTDELEARLRHVSPQFTDLHEAVALRTAASIALRRPRGAEPRWGEEAECADGLARTEPPVRAELIDAVDAYRSELDATGLRDRDVIGQQRRARRRLAVSAAGGLLLLPFALVGLGLHLPVVAAALLTRRLDVAAGTKATVRPVVAVVASLLTWAAIAVVAFRLGGWESAVESLLAVPLWGACALVLSERLILGLRALRSRRRTRRAGRGDVLDALRADRARIVELVRRHAAS